MSHDPCGGDCYGEVKEDCEKSGLVNFKQESICGSTKFDCMLAVRAF